MIRSGGFNMGDWSGAAAIAGFILTIALLILNLKVSGAQADMKTALQVSRTEFATSLSEVKISVEKIRAEHTASLSEVKLSVEKLRGDLYQEHAKLYAQVMEKGSVQYMGRELSLQMHAENLKRLDDFRKQLEDLTTRVGDIS